MLSVKNMIKRTINVKLNESMKNRYIINIYSKYLCVISSLCPPRRVSDVKLSNVLCKTSLTGVRG